MAPLLKVLSTNKLIKARLGVSRTIYVNVDSPNLGFTYFNFLGGGQLKNHPVYWPQGTVFNPPSSSESVKYMDLGFGIMFQPQTAWPYHPTQNSQKYP